MGVKFAKLILPELNSHKWWFVGSISQELDKSSKFLLIQKQIKFWSVTGINKQPIKLK